ncbi:MAG: HEAT repeat domain-containing protein [Spirosomataceae bacterium]
MEFVGTPTGSHIWSFGLKPKGASFDFDSEKDVVSGILPTGIKFGPDGALYAADWINGWDTKNYGRVWKFDAAKDKNDLADIRQETKRLIQLDYTAQTEDYLYHLLSYADMRVRQKAQFELVNRGKKGFPLLQKAVTQTQHQLARVHGIWGVGQLARQDASYASALFTLLHDSDLEIVAQAAKMLGDARIATAGSELVPLLKSKNPRVQFFAAEAIGRIAYAEAVQPLIELLKTNNDEDLYLRHAAVLALSRIGKVEPMVALANNPSKALRTAAVLVLRRLRNENIAVFLKDTDEYIVTEAARGINDDLSIPGALPALAATLKETRFTSEPLLRRAINAALRVGGSTELETLLTFLARTDLKDDIKAEALATLGTWANPSVLDRVDGRYRGKIERDLAGIQAKVRPYIAGFLKETNPETQIATASLLGELKITDANSQLASIYETTANARVKTAILQALNQLDYADITSLIKKGMDDKEESVRTAALSLLSDANVTQENLPAIVNSIFSKGTLREQQQILVVMGKLNLSKTQSILDGMIGQLSDKKLSPSLALELKEAIEATGSEALKTKLALVKPSQSPLDEYAETLYGGSRFSGRNYFFNSSSGQCVRCHTIGGSGGTVGPVLTHIGDVLTREQILQALIEPSARLSPGFGMVSLKLKDGQEVTGTLAKESDEELVINTSDAEPLVIKTARIAKRENMPSSMPPMGSVMSKREIRDVVEFLATLKK